MKGGWIFGTVLAIVVGASAAPAVMPQPRQVPLSRPLAAAVPATVGPWRAAGEALAAPAAGAEVLRRRYARASGQVVDLEIRYYAAGVPHSPMLPLPGPEWERNVLEVVPMETDGGWVPVNRVQAATEPSVPDRRDLVLVYWYHERGRIVAKESWAKLYQIRDRLLRRRVGGALVSVSTGAGDPGARERVTDFARLILPTLAKVFPE